jgi:transcription-repair coupling factor (superfamily II helicase)
MGSVVPYRIDLWTNEIETLRTFDVDTQRTIYKVADVRLLPGASSRSTRMHARCFAAASASASRAIPRSARSIRTIGRGATPAGIEYYLPLFFERTATLTDYLPPETIVCLHGDLSTAVTQFWTDTDARYR